VPYTGGNSAHYDITVESGPEALSLARERPYDFVFTDLKMPGVDGMEVLKTFQQEYPNTINVMITGFSTVETAVEAMKLGAVAYLRKPVDEQRLLDRGDSACLREEILAS
jgi:DNA-binding NtrC family response regulator